jgi:hypothetical protein
MTGLVTKAFEMMKCSHCGDLKEPFGRNLSYCGDCRDDSRKTVYICGNCEEREAKDDSELCPECAAAEKEARVTR